MPDKKKSLIPSWVTCSLGVVSVAVSVAAMGVFSGLTPDEEEHTPFVGAKNNYRDLVVPSQNEYNAAGRVFIEGQNICAGSIGSFEGYRFSRAGLAVSTAAHCVLNNQGQIAQDISFVVTFNDVAGTAKQLVLSRPIIWVDGRYQEDDKAVGGTEQHDKAILFFENASLPNEIEPISIFVAEDASWQSIQQYFNVSALSKIDPKQNQDKCSVLNTSGAYQRTTCSLSYSDSGSGLFVQANDGQIKMIGIASEFATGEQPDNALSAYTYFTHEDFKRQPPEFLIALN